MSVACWSKIESFSQVKQTGDGFGNWFSLNHNSNASEGGLLVECVGGIYLYYMRLGRDFSGFDVEVFYVDFA